MVKVFVCFMLAAGTCSASGIFADDVRIRFGGYSKLGIGGVSATEQDFPEFQSYKLSGTACIDPFCDEHVGFIPHPAADPLTMRVRDLKLTCTSIGLKCAPVQTLITFEFGFFDPGDPLIGTTVPVSLNVEGIGAPGYQFRLFAEAATPGTPQVTPFFEQFTADGSGAFGATFPLGDFTFGEFTDVNFFVNTTPLADFESFVIRRITWTFGSADGAPTPVPEPATLFLVAAGISARGLLRRRRGWISTRSRS